MSDSSRTYGQHPNANSRSWLRCLLARRAAWTLLTSVIVWGMSALLCEEFIGQHYTTTVMQAFLPSSEESKPLQVNDLSLVEVINTRPLVVYKLVEGPGLGSTLFGLAMSFMYLAAVYNLSTMVVVESQYGYRRNHSLGVLSGYLTPQFQVIDRASQHFLVDRHLPPGTRLATCRPKRIPTEREMKQT